MACRSEMVLYLQGARQCLLLPLRLVCGGIEHVEGEDQPRRLDIVAPTPCLASSKPSSAQCFHDLIIIPKQSLMMFGNLLQHHQAGHRHIILSLSSQDDAQHIFRGRGHFVSTTGSRTRDEPRTHGGEVDPRMSPGISRRARPTLPGSQPRPAPTVISARSADLAPAEAQPSRAGTCLTTGGARFDTHLLVDVMRRV